MKENAALIMMLFAVLLAALAGRPYSAGAEEERENPSAYTVEEVWFERNGLRIYGELYLPEKSGRLPLVILSHGFGGNLTSVQGYARAFAENGIAACAFDFTGGGRGSRSDGQITEMSVLTEAADLNAVIDGLLAREEIDPSELYLFGCSQGGFVSTYAAGTRPEKIKGLISLYPAYVLQDDARERTPDPENLPETTEVMGTPIGRIYTADALSFDIYDVMKNYPGDVLILHGTADGIVPISYSERAVKVFPSAGLVRFEGAGHGFYGNDAAQAAQLAVDFVRERLDSQDERGSEAVSPAKLQMEMKIDGTPVSVVWENNSSVDELKRLASDHPLTIRMSMYGGFEQVGSLGADLPRQDWQTTTDPGDIVLYSGDQIVIFYGSNSWAYTRLGHISDKTPDEMRELLGNHDVTVTLRLE